MGRFFCKPVCRGCKSRLAEHFYQLSDRQDAHRAKHRCPTFTESKKQDNILKNSDEQCKTRSLTTREPGYYRDSGYGGCQHGKAVFVDNYTEYLSISVIPRSGIVRFYFRCLRRQ